MSLFSNLGEMHLDVLKEIGSIGTGNAVTAISGLLNKKVQMDMPTVNLVEFGNLADFVGGPENILVGILVGISSDINGMMMFLMDIETAKRLVDSVLNGMGQDKNTKLDGIFNEMEFSVIEEIGNIMAGSYLGSLSGLTNLRIRQSVPMAAIDMANALLSVPAIEFGKMADHVLYINSSFSVEQVDVSGYFILVPDEESFVKVMRSLGVGI
ncbi:MAG: chemotaxis protein CheC [Defluviitaleaceae bacterium]|nr:chemotaxis protein CheC [Defluviitaleaceae bacterium]